MKKVKLFEEYYGSYDSYSELKEGVELALNYILEKLEEAKKLCYKIPYEAEDALNNWDSIHGSIENNIEDALITTEDILYNLDEVLEDIKRDYEEEEDRRSKDEDEEIEKYYKKGEENSEE